MLTYIIRMLLLILTIFINQLTIFNHHISTMTKKIQPRAKLAHKLAKYVRSTPVHLLGNLSGVSKPSISHLTLGGQKARKVKNNAKTWYPADDEKALYKRRRNQAKSPVAPKSIQAGQVVILLAGAHRGRRVVVLKSLASGNLLVTGPHCINGVPLKRVNASYVIKTSTTVPLDGVAVNVDDSFFKLQSRFTKDQLKHASETTNKKCEAAKAADEKWRNEAKAIQKSVDEKLMANIKKVDQLKGYLGTRFTLYSNTRPHELVF